MFITTCPIRTVKNHFCDGHHKRTKKLAQLKVQMFFPSILERSDR